MTLTDQHRAWLEAPGRNAMTTWQVTLDFIRVFRLDPGQAGALLAQWAKEKWNAL